MTTPMGRPVADLEDFLEPVVERPLQSAPEPATAGHPAPSRARWWIAVAALLVAAGGAAFWYSERRPDTPTAEAAPSAVSATTTPLGVAGFAELYVAAYLTGNGTDIAEFLPGAPSLAAMTPAAHYVTRAAALEIDAVADHYWRVVIAVDVLTLDGSGYVPTGLQYFQVGVVDDGGRLVAAALPARVAGPAPRNAAPRSLSSADTTPSAEHHALVGDFLEALLLGTRDLSWYTTADSSISAVKPAPFTAFTVTGLSLYDDTTGVVAVDAQEVGGAIASMQYVLRFADEGSGLVVAELLAGPPRLEAAATGGE